MYLMLFLIALLAPLRSSDAGVYVYIPAPMLEAPTAPVAAPETVRLEVYATIDEQAEAIITLDVSQGYQIVGALITSSDGSGRCKLLTEATLLCRALIKRFEPVTVQVFTLTPAQASCVPYALVARASVGAYEGEQTRLRAVGAAYCLALPVVTL